MKRWIDINGLSREMEIEGPEDQISQFDLDLATIILRMFGGPMTAYANVPKARRLVTLLHEKGYVITEIFK